MTALSGRYGHRGAWLIILGAVWMLFGVGVLLDAPEARPWVLYEYLPVWAQAVGWWVTGGVAVWQGLHGPAAPGRPDVVGHVALYLMPGVRLVSFALSFSVWVGSSIAAAAHVIDDPFGFREGWYAAAVWAFIVVMLHHAASWPEPRRPIPRPPVGASGEV